MDRTLLRAFQVQIWSQCEFARLAVHDIRNYQGDSYRLWYGVQNLLVAAANISKALWGSKGRAAERRRDLRESIGVEDSSPLRHVLMRDHFEHFDERLDTWWTDSESHCYFDMNYGLDIKNADKKDTFRDLRRDGTLVFWGETFDLNAIIREIERIHPIVAI